MSRPVFRLLTVAAAATAAVGLTALPALAHVTVNSPGATQGSFGVVTFRMPNEMDNANATELKVQLPADQPLASVAVKPEPGLVVHGHPGQAVARRSRTTTATRSPTTSR